MIQDIKKDNEWKQINYRTVVTALGIEFLHDLYNQYYPSVNSLRFRNTITLCKGSEVTSYAPKQEWNFIADWFGEKFIRGDLELINEIKAYIKDPKKRLMKLLTKIKKTKLKELDDKGLGLLLIDFHYTVLTVIYKINLVQIEHALSHAIDKLCEPYFPEMSKRNTAISCLLHSPKPTVGVEEERDFIDIILYGSKKGIKNISAKKDNKVADKISKHYLKYRYIHSAYGANPYTLNYYIKRYNECAHEGFNKMKDKLKEIKKNNNLMIKKKQALHKKIINDKILIENIELMISIGNLRDRNKALLGTTIELREKILKEISNRKNIDPAQINYYFLYEISNLLSENKKISEEVIHQRKKSLVVYRKEYITTNVSEAEQELVNENKKELCGTCASPGKIENTVKIISSSEHINKIKRGEIIVARGTDFDLINAMQKSGGIITEEGGILSHASVISRELGIPCLIGVTQATKILKDGMVVIMDADKGIIKIKR